MTNVGVPVEVDLLLGGLCLRHDPVGQFLVLEALGRLDLGHAARAHRGDQRIDRLVDEGPFVLLGEQELVGGEGLVVAEAAGQHEGRDVDRIARELTEDEAHLAGVDVVLLQLRKGLLAEDGAVRAGQRTVFDHRDAGGPTTSSGSGPGASSLAMSTVRSGWGAPAANAFEAATAAAHKMAAPASRRRVAKATGEGS